jgi:hypothetical protein
VLVRVCEDEEGNILPTISYYQTPRPDNVWADTVTSPLIPTLSTSSYEYFRSHYGPGVDSAYNINEYQEYLLEVKAAGA